MRPPVLRLIAPMLAVALSACGASQAGTASRASTPAATPTLSPTAAPTPRVTVVDAAYLATELGGVEQGIRLPDSPAEEYLSLGRRQQSAYHLLDRNQHGPHPGIELRGRAGTDAVHAGDLGQLWPRRRQQPARRDPRRWSLPAGARRAGEYDAGDLRLQPEHALCTSRPALCR